MKILSWQQWKISTIVSLRRLVTTGLTNVMICAVLACFLILILLYFSLYSYLTNGCERWFYFQYNSTNSHSSQGSHVGYLIPPASCLYPHLSPFLPSFLLPQQRPDPQARKLVYVFFHHFCFAHHSKKTHTIRQSYVTWNVLGEIRVTWERKKGVRCGQRAVYAAARCHYWRKKWRGRMPREGHDLRLTCPKWR